MENIRVIKRVKHSKKEIDEAIKFAEAQGWRYQPAGKSSHAWGRMLCPQNERDGCSMSIWSTPRDATVHASQILRKVKSCPHNMNKNDC